MNNYKSITDMNKELLTELKAHIRTRHIIKVKTGFQKLDEMTHGFERGISWVIAADTSVGKSMLLVNFAYEVALQKHTVLYVTTEMTTLQLVLRITAMRSGINYDKLLKDNGLNDAKCYLRPLFKAAREVLKLPIAYSEMYYVDNISRLIQQYKPNLVIVDYIQDMKSGNRRHSDFQRLEYISQKLSYLAKHERTCIVAATQTHRFAIGEKIGLHSAKGSSGIEQKADVYATLTNYDNNQDDSDDSPRRLKLSILKGRHLYSKGSIDLVFDPPTLRIKEL